MKQPVVAGSTQQPTATLVHPNADLCGAATADFDREKTLSCACGGGCGSGQDLLDILCDCRWLRRGPIPLNHLPLAVYRKLGEIPEGRLTTHQAWLCLTQRLEERVGLTSSHLGARKHGKGGLEATAGEVMSLGVGWQLLVEVIGRKCKDGKASVLVCLVQLLQPLELSCTAHARGQGWKQEIDRTFTGSHLEDSSHTDQTHVAALQGD